MTVQHITHTASLRVGPGVDAWTVSMRRLDPNTVELYDCTRPPSEETREQVRRFLVRNGFKQVVWFRKRRGKFKSMQFRLSPEQPRQQIAKFPTLAAI